MITLKNISKTYATVEAVRNVDLSIPDGCIFGIIGRSGAGKSTLLSLISGLDSCMEGTIYYNGKSMQGIDRDEYRSKNVGVIFQGYNLLLNSTAVYNITLSMNISGSSQNRKTNKNYAYSLLDKVGIDKETADRKILKLSGGEQQRIGIARALSHNPDVIIADEPTGNLDEKTEADILKIFSELAHKDGKCVIIVTHSDNVSDIADTVCKISGGSILDTI